jgi:hypothetical protein
LVRGQGAHVTAPFANVIQSLFANPPGSVPAMTRQHAKGYATCQFMGGFLAEFANCLSLLIRLGCVVTGHGGLLFAMIGVQVVVPGARAIAGRWIGA